MATAEQKQLPDAIEMKMKLWRLDLLPLPQEYIDWHKNAAEEIGIPELKNAGYIIHNQQLVNDGWCDGMRFVQVIVEHRTGRLFKLKWSDNQRWYAHSPCGGGWTLFDPKVS